MSLKLLIKFYSLLEYNNKYENIPLGFLFIKKIIFLLSHFSILIVGCFRIYLTFTLFEIIYIYQQL